jgi:hypothetical protein
MLQSSFTLFLALAAFSASAQPMHHGGTLSVVPARIPAHIVLTARKMHRVVRRQNVIGASVVPIAPGQAPAPVAGIGANFVGSPSVVPVNNAPPAAAPSPIAAAGIGAQALGPVRVVDPAATGTPAALGVAPPSSSAAGIGAVAVGPVTIVGSSSSVLVPTATLTSLSASASASDIFQNLGVATGSSFSSVDEVTKTSDCTDQPTAAPTGNVRSAASEGDDEEQDRNSGDQVDDGDDDSEQDGDSDDQVDASSSTEDCTKTASSGDAQDTLTASDAQETSTSSDDLKAGPVTRTVTVFIDPTDVRSARLACFA